MSLVFESMMLHIRFHKVAIAWSLALATLNCFAAVSSRVAQPFKDRPSIRTLKTLHQGNDLLGHVWVNRKVTKESWPPHFFATFSTLFDVTDRTWVDVTDQVQFLHVPAPGASGMLNFKLAGYGAKTGYLMVQYEANFQTCTSAAGIGALYEIQFVADEFPTKRGGGQLPGTQVPITLPLESFHGPYVLTGATDVWYQQESNFALPDPIFYQQTASMLHSTFGSDWSLADSSLKDWPGDCVNYSIRNFETGLLTAYVDDVYEDPDHNYDPRFLHEEIGGFIRQYADTLATSITAAWSESQRVGRPRLARQKHTRKKAKAGGN